MTLLTILNFFDNLNQDNDKDNPETFETLIKNSDNGEPVFMTPEI